MCVAVEMTGGEWNWVEHGGPDGSEERAMEGGVAESGERAEMLQVPYPLCEARP